VTRNRDYDPGCQFVAVAKVSENASASVDPAIAVPSVGELLYCVYGNPAPYFHSG
jgi:hypothetical protein